MGKSAESFQRNVSDAEARVEGYLPGRCLVWGLGGSEDVGLGLAGGLFFLVPKPQIAGVLPPF